VCSPDECHSCSESVACLGAKVNGESYCVWKDKGKKCQGSSHSLRPNPTFDPAPHFSGASLEYYQGQGIAIWPGTADSHHITIVNNKVHHCPGSGIRANKVDYMTIRSNIVYDNCWWTVSATSGIVFAESQASCEPPLSLPQHPCHNY
jgi:hypothetical protein